MGRRSKRPLSAGVLGLWVALLVGYCAYALAWPQPPESVAIIPERFAPSDFLPTASTNRIIDIQTSGADAVIGILDSSCPVCFERAEDILRVLEAVGTEVALIRVDTVTAPTFDSLYGDLPMYYLSPESAVQVGYVPTFLRLHEGEPSILWSGMPSRLQVLVQSMTRRR